MSNTAPYPIITKGAARAWYSSYQDGESIEPTISQSPFELSTSLVEVLHSSVANAISELQGLVLKNEDGKFIVDTAKYEFQVGKILFEKTRTLPTFVLADPDFWRWFSLAHPENLRIIQTRHSSLPTDKVNYVNFGIGNIREGFFSRCWLRVYLTFDESRKDVFELSRKGDQDFWRSHVLRQSYAKSGQFIRALVSFQYAGPEPTLKPSGNSSTLSIREMAKRLSVTLSTIALDVMNYEESLTFIHAIHEEMIEDSVGGS